MWRTRRRRCIRCPQRYYRRFPSFCGRIGRAGRGKPPRGHKSDREIKTTGKTIALNKRARHDYHLDERLEAGLALEGWEAKSLREGRVQLRDGHVLLKDGEAWLLGASIAPLPSVGPHRGADPVRSRKLLLHRREIDRLRGAVERKGYTLIPTSLYWKGRRVKLEFALARGKKAHDKRIALRERDWNRQKQRLLRSKQ